MDTLFAAHVIMVMEALYITEFGKSCAAADAPLKRGTIVYEITLIKEKGTGSNCG